MSITITRLFGAGGSPDVCQDDAVLRNYVALVDIVGCHTMREICFQESDREASIPNSNNDV